MQRTDEKYLEHMHQLPTNRYDIRGEATDRLSPREIYFCNLAVDRPEWLGQFVGPTQGRLATNKTSLRRQTFEPTESSKPWNILK